MRGGKFLAEESPECLLQQYNCDSLEDVFLKLAVLQNMGKRRRSSIVQEVTVQVAVPAITVIFIFYYFKWLNVTNDRIIFMQNPALDLSEEDIGEISGEFGDNISMTLRGIETITTDVPAPPLPPEEEPPEETDVVCFVKPHHMKALIWKNFLWMWRNVG